MDVSKLNRGDNVFFCRCLWKLNIYDVMSMKVVYTHEDGSMTVANEVFSQYLDPVTAKEQVFLSKSAADEYIQNRKREDNVKHKGEKSYDYRSLKSSGDEE